MALLPTVYEYYTGGGITAGLSADQPHFTLNNKNITIYSGAMHYFRVPQEHWRDRLRKMRAAGLNTVETYMPWNLHEFQDGVNDLGNGGSDFSRFLDFQRFLQIAKEEDLLAIIRPGPYICSEWDFGGLPAWLLKNKGIRVRTSDELFMARVANYLQMVLFFLSFLNFTAGGPIIAYQIENEYGSLGQNDTKYLNGLKQLYLDNGAKELLFTSDGASLGNLGQIPGVLYTANFAGDATNQLNIAQSYQPGKPSMVMEFWAGWFDHWTEQHHTVDSKSFRNTLQEILDYPASVNFYMFHGGTNFGFMNGANLANGNADNSGYQPDTNSYDYDAALNEHGDYTEKYWIIREVLAAHAANPTRTPEPPAATSLTTYPKIKITEEIDIQALISQLSLSSFGTFSEQLVTMEEVNQNYGYIVYSKNVTLPNNTELKVLGHLRDTLMVLLNGELVSPVLNHPRDLKGFGYWKSKDQVLVLPECNDCTLDLIVENWGRVNFGGLHQFEQQKGLQEGQVLINGKPLVGINVTTMSFPWYHNKYYENWKPYNNKNTSGPKLYKALLKVEQDEPKDTYIDMRGWNKGIVIVNDYVLSRYCKLGPQQALYLPGPFLKKGDNTVLVFEHFEGQDEIAFNAGQIFETIQ